MLENLKILLGIDASETSIDAKLSLLLSMATARLKNRLGGIEPPEELEHIIIDAAIKRFNRIGSEGLTSHSVDGESYSFADDDFSEYDSEIQEYLSTLDTSAKGRVRFL